MLPYRTKVTKILFALFIFVIIGYAIYEVQTMLLGPQIYIENPKGGLVVSTEKVSITGVVENVAHITINGTPILITESGAFTEHLLLSPGINRFVFDARDKFDREKSEILEIMYSPPPNTTRTLDTY